MTSTAAGQAATLLTQRIVDIGVPALKSSEYWNLAGQCDDLGDLFGKTPGDLHRKHHLDAAFADRVAALLDGARSVAFKLEELEQTGIRVVTAADPEYPDRLHEVLGKKAPAILYVAGAVTLLKHPAIGAVGSRDADPDAINVAAETGRTAVARGFALVSGAARGIDEAAMISALNGGGHAIGYIADALATAIRSTKWRTHILSGRLVLASPYIPTARFMAANAMGRNKLIYAQAQATLAVTSDDNRGGTWAGATEAHRHGYGAVAVWRGPGEREGNQKLERLGIPAIAHVDEIVRIALDPPARPAQMPLAL